MNVLRPVSGTDQTSRIAAIVVLGMHRSGTSSVAGALVRLGGAAPLRLMAPSPANERGFWESLDIRAVNDDVLAAGGSHWMDWRKFDCGRIDRETADALHARARSTLAAEFAEAGIPIVKDPRMCRLMRFWAPVFEENEWSMRAVLPLRSPLEVAWSLVRRDGARASLGCLLWLRHVLDAEAETRGMTRAIVDWSHFVNDHRAALDRLVDQLGLPWPRWREKGLADVDAFVSSRLRRCNADADDLQADPTISALVRETYAEMLGLVEDPENTASLARLDSIRARFDSAVPLFDSVIRDLDAERAGLAARLAALEKERDALGQKLEQANAVVARVTERYADQSSAAIRNRLPRLERFAGDRKALRAIRNSALFDAAFYLEANPDVRESGLDPAAHYLTEGARQGRDPSRYFSTNAYLARNPDVAEAGANPLAHYEMRGRKENRPAIG